MKLKPEKFHENWLDISCPHPNLLLKSSGRGRKLQKHAARAACHRIRGSVGASRDRANFAAAPREYCCKRCFKGPQCICFLLPYGVMISPNALACTSHQFLWMDVIRTELHMNYIIWLLLDFITSISALEHTEVVVQRRYTVYLKGMYDECLPVTLPWVLQSPANVAFSFADNVLPADAIKVSRSSSKTTSAPISRYWYISTKASFWALWFLFPSPAKIQRVAHKAYQKLSLVSSVFVNFIKHLCCLYVFVNCDEIAHQGLTSWAIILTCNILMGLHQKICLSKLIAVTMLGRSRMQYDE